MTEKVNSIIEILKARYPEAPCALHYTKDYELMIAVRLSAQCTDARVNLVTPALFAAYPTLEAMAAADIADVPKDKNVCELGKGPAVSFMDRATVYDKEFYNAALNSGIDCQPKRAVAGGNNSAAVHLSREGVRTLAISLPCRYIHSASCVANTKDFKAMKDLTEYMLNGIAGGSIK